ncbi:MAG: L-tyrosine decarboxylase [Candidatus Bathyarchaeota archaeon BA2]|nr:MAG: L-tyrosine decarboxylase [Candidatus Bathyarchaeota archaeon BA2]
MTLQMMLRRMNEMPEKGLPKSVILKELETKLQRDLTYSSGKILGSMCTEPHSLAKQIYLQYFEKNLGDPGLFPAAAELEQEAIRMLGLLLSNPNACGRIVSSGTEANILALWTARNRAKKERGEVIVPVSAHCSFDKACDLLNLKLIKVRLNRRFQMDVKAAEEAVTSKTVVMVGVAGTTGLGVVDPIHELSEIALAHNIYLHVDAAFGGFVLPFFEELGLDAPEFDFRLPGVCSITIDSHKMGLAPIPAGGILFKDASMTEAISMRVPYLAGGETEQFTVMGTRSGASSIAVWALLMHLGREGYKAVVEQCLKLTGKLVEGIQQIDGIDIVTQPTINVVGIKSNIVDARLVAKELRKRGWAVALFPGYIRIVVMPHVKLSHIESFLEDLGKVMKKLDG